MKKNRLIWFVLLIVLAGCQITTTQQTKFVTDDLGRRVELPVAIDRIAPSGHPAQILLYTLAPDKMVGWARYPSKAQQKYMAEQYLDLPEFGAFYGSRGDLNKEALLASQPQLIVDFGEEKPGIVEDLNRLQGTLGVPVIFISGDLETMAQAYLTLGDVIGRSERAAQLADFCEETINYAAERRQQVENPVKIYYGDGDHALQAVAADSVHGRVIHLIGAENVAKIEQTTGDGGHIIDGEQLYHWQPQLILINRPQAYQYAKHDKVFQHLNAPLYQVPVAFYNWMGRPPSINQLLGIYWLGDLVYPDLYQADLRQKVSQFYALFFNYQLSDEELDNLLNHQ